MTKSYRKISRQKVIFILTKLCKKHMFEIYEYKKTNPESNWLGVTNFYNDLKIILITPTTVRDFYDRLKREVVIKTDLFEITFKDEDMWKPSVVKIKLNKNDTRRTGY